MDTLSAPGLERLVISVEFIVSATPYGLDSWLLLIDMIPVFALGCSWCLKKAD